MDGGRILLGRQLWDPHAGPLGAQAGPLVARDHKGHHVAVCPTGPSHGAGVLLVGPSGAGKTSLLRPALTDLIRTHAAQPASLDLTLADGKGADSLLMFTGQPGVAAVVTTPDPASGEVDPLPVVVREFHAEVRRRYDAFRQARRDAMLDGGPVRWQPGSLCVLCLDEYGDWNLGLTPKLRAEMVRLLSRCGQIGREVNCRIILAMQAPYAKLAEVMLPGPLKQQLSIRIAMAGEVGISEILAGMVFDDRGIGGPSGRLERYADRAELVGDARKGVGLVQLGGLEVPFKAPRMADPYHWETSPEDAAAALALLPYRPTGTELRRLLRREAA